MTAYNLSKKTIVADHLLQAIGMWQRMVGLLGRSSLKKGEALLIPQCHSIHMFFMRFPIDVIFVDKKYQVVGLVRNIKPFQMSPIFFKAYFAIEGAVGMIEDSQVELGDLLEIKN